MILNIEFNDKTFIQDMMNIVRYSEGFLEGIHKGKLNFLKTLGFETVEAIKEFVDINARIDPEMLSHLYEWYESGNPNSRLFDIQYTDNNSGLTFNHTFSQSKTVQSGSNVPFYNKAEIMENGIPVTIVPKKSKVLAFDVNGETVFSSSSITVNNPGGIAAKDGLKKIIDIFFETYFTQSFLQSSGIIEYIKNPIDFEKNLPAGKRGGKSEGIKIGNAWISKAGTLGI